MNKTTYAPKAVIFDLDGTIIDTEKFYRKVWPKALKHFGYDMTDAQVLELRSLGRPFAPKKLKEWFGEDFDYDKVRSYRKELFEECVKEEGIVIKPGVKKLLEYLKEKGIIIAIATATDIPRATRYLDAVGITGLFDKICSAADVPEGKPAPYVYLEACKQLGLEPAECFAVEDAPNGIISAAKAGCKVIFVPDQTESEPEAEKLIYAKAKTADEIIGLLC
ncbi:MAG: HAD family phosphatase [Lachnospiraceae bacterium]|nr:HAD family phosphatase [Lachnospiraceae bacterium]